MDQEARSLIELLRDETQSRSVFERCNAVLAVAAPLRHPVTGREPDIDINLCTSPGTAEEVNERWRKSVRSMADAWAECLYGTTNATSAIQGVIDEIHADEAEVEIITGERK